MSLDPAVRTLPKICRIEFWSGLSADIDLNDIEQNAIHVKGESYHSPLRFLQIYADNSTSRHFSCSSNVYLKHDNISQYSWDDIKRIFFSSIPNADALLAESEPQPPFAWRDSSPTHLCISFTYNTNAFYRIFKNLQKQALVDPLVAERLLDKACLVLAQLYKANNFFLVKNINNNFNMYLISKVVEFLVGKDIYNADRQEVDLTRRSLTAALEISPSSAEISTVEKMGVAIGRGVSFIESRLEGTGLPRAKAQQVQDVSHRYYKEDLAIDDRLRLLEMISNGGLHAGSFFLAVILDDTTESVDDLLWILDLMREFPFLEVQLLVNTAQISVNFSSDMLKDVLRADSFVELASRLGTQFFVTEFYCPLISFQRDQFPLRVRLVIDQADAVYIKGANFFETCQISEKETFHAFVVFGPISRAYSGLKDYSGVFVNLPAGVPGYVHSADPKKIVTLADIVRACRKNTLTF